MNRLVLPASGSTLTGLLALSLWKRGVKDIALGFGIASATLAYFSVFDFLRGRDPEHKAQLYKKRKAAWEESNARPIIGILKQQAARIGGLANLRKPQMGQGLMMQFIQAGEQSLQRQDLATATKYFTYGVDVSYISQGPEAAQKLINTVGSMIPHIVGQIQADFAKDKKAIDRMLAEEEKPMISRDEMIKSIKENQDLDVDPIDESDEEAEEPKKAFIEEVIEEDVLDEEPIDDDDAEPVVQTVAEPVQAVNAEEVVAKAEEVVVVEEIAEKVIEDSVEEVVEEVAELAEVAEVAEAVEEVAEVAEEVAEEAAESEEEDKVVDEVKIENIQLETTETIETSSAVEEIISEPEIEEESEDEITSAEIVEVNELEDVLENEVIDEKIEETPEPVDDDEVTQVDTEPNADEIGDAPPSIVKTTVETSPPAAAAAPAINEMADEDLE